MPNRETKLAKELESSFEIDQYVKALGEASSRVRFVMLAVIVASVASIATLWSEHDGAWERSRLKVFDTKYSLLTACGVWEHPLEYRERCEEPHQPESRIEGETAISPPTKINYALLPPECQNEETICDAIRWFNDIGISTNRGAEAFAEKQWEAYINNVRYVKSPVLGFTFDINDLGLLTGLTFSILMLVMVFYSNRAHENLAVSMWKVREITKTEHCYDDPGSKANLLYHALAMQQVFTVPPTLARWQDLRIFSKSHYALFILPFLVQMFVLHGDFKSAPSGFNVNRTQTLISLSGQTFFLLLALFLCLLCWAHLHADDMLWEDVFLFINPSHRFQAKSRWRHWVKIADNHPPAWGLAVRRSRKQDGWREILFVDSISGHLCSVEARTALGENVFPIGSVNVKTRTAYRGLYLPSITDEPRFYSRSHIERRFGRVPKQRSRLKIDDTTATTSDKIGILSGLSNAAETFYLSRSSLRKVTADTNMPIWSAGGLAYQKDGPGRYSGFAAIHSLVPDEDALFVTDGAWIRRIDSAGEVSTWGGKPLGLYLRPERAFLLGMVLLGNGRTIEAQGRKQRETLTSYKLLVCDHSLRRVLAVDENRVAEAYRSDRGWAPAGIALDGETIYLLEYRNDRMLGEWINYLLKRHPNNILIKLAFPFWHYLRILRFEGSSFNNPKVVYALSSFRRRLASSPH
jgi:hypothetical protein